MVLKHINLIILSGAKTIFTALYNDTDKNLIKINGPYNCKERIRNAIERAFQSLKKTWFAMVNEN